MSFLQEAERVLKKITQPDPRLRERKLTAGLLAAKFDGLLRDSMVVNCRNVLGPLAAPLPVEIGALRVEVLLSKGMLDREDEYFCSVVGKDEGFGYRLKGVQCEVFPITTLPVAKKISFGAENLDPLGRDLQKLSLGHRLLDVLIDVSARNPDLFKEGYS